MANYFDWAEALRRILLGGTKHSHEMGMGRMQDARVSKREGSNIKAIYIYIYGFSPFLVQENI